MENNKNMKLTLNIQKEVWIITDKARTVIAKGNPRDRHLIRLDDTKDKKRVLTYTTELKAIKAFTDNWFYTNSAPHIEPEDLEAVKVNIKLEEL